jgi:hypothetical protein
LAQSGSAPKDAGAHALRPPFGRGIEVRNGLIEPQYPERSGASRFLGQVL